MELKTFFFSASCIFFLPAAALSQEAEEDAYGGFWERPETGSPNNVKSSAKDWRSGWAFSVSAGTLISPAYLGADEYQVSVFPNLSVQYEDLFFASLEGVGFNLIRQNGFRAGPIARYDFGRDEDGSNPLGFGGETDDLKGFGDVDGTVELGGFVEYSYRQFSARVELRQGVGGHEGLVGEAGLKYGNSFSAFGRPVFFELGPEITFADDTYNSAFFDVSAAQSAASGLSEFDAGGGVNTYGFHASLVVPLTDKVSLIGFGGVDQLTGDIADSSLVRERGSETQGIAGIMLNYRF